MSTRQHATHLVLLVSSLHSLQLEPVMLEDGHVLVCEISAQRVPGQDAVDLFQQVERVVRAGDVGERAIDEELQAHLEVVDVDVELEVLAVELRVVKVQEIQALAPHIIGDGTERGDHVGQAIDVRVPLQ